MVSGNDISFAYAKTKAQISFAVTAKLISAFVFATRIVQSLFFLNPKLQDSSFLLLLYRSVCVRPGRKPRRPVFWRCDSYQPYGPCTNHQSNARNIWPKPMSEQHATPPPLQEVHELCSMSQLKTKRLS